MAEGTAVERMMAAWNDPDYQFTRDQVIHFLSLILGDGPGEDLAYRAGFDAGYWARVAEENRAYPPRPHRVTTSAAEDAIRVYRRRVGVDVVTARPNDYRGGPMPVWDDDEQEGDDDGSRANRDHSRAA